MLKVLLARMQQKKRTVSFPRGAAVVPDRLRGMPVVDTTRCPAGCRTCAGACSVGAISFENELPVIDLGKCLFCTDCTDACPQKAVRFTTEFRLSTGRRDDLLVRRTAAYRLAAGIEDRSRRIFGRSLKLRQVSAGGCNACEADNNVLTTVVFDLGRFGIQFVASPRHADGILVTGPVSANMKLALEKTYAAVPSPRLVIAVGSCAISGGPFAGHPEVAGGAGALVPIDLFVPGCPPHPLTILDGLLRIIGRL